MIVSLFIVVGFDVIIKIQNRRRLNYDAACHQFHNAIGKTGNRYLKIKQLYLRMKILMVCLGNICRSPLAEGILLQKIKIAGLDWFVDSAGTNGFHVNEAPHYLSQRVAKKRGIDISKQLCRRFVPEDFDRFDKIYAMAADVLGEMKKISGNQFVAEKADLLLNVVHPGENLEVPDPWYGPEAGYEEVFALIDEACEMLIKNYSRPS
jgi:protein-tyrosine phosphatase